jgi:YidC/Oxa1 family membrane protein insertase
MKDKILNLLIVLLLSFLIFNILQKSDKKVVETGNILFSMSKSSYSIPVSAKLIIENKTSSGILIDTCKNITLNQNGSILSFPKEFCKVLTIPSLWKESLSLSPYFSLFSQTGNYVFELQADGKKYVAPFEISNKWTISKIFTYLFYAPIYNLTIYLIEIFSYSLWMAIIVVTILIRILLLWPQHKMLVSQQKLQKVQPKIKALQEKHKGDAQALWLELMKLYSSEKVNPMGSCWFLAIQMPILLVIYNVISTISDPVNTYYLYWFLNGFSVDQIQTYFYGLDLVKAGWVTWVVLWVLVWIVQYIQVKLSLVLNLHQKELAKKETVATDFQSFMPDPAVLNKFMQYGMPIMVWFFTYSLFAWVWIYWWISTLFGIFQQLFVNKLLKK